MSWKEVAGRGTWWGVLTAAILLCALLGIAALCLVRGVLPESGMYAAVYVSVAVSCFAGGRTALRWGSGGTVPRTLAVSGCVYAAMWLASVGGETEISFAPQAVILTACVWGSGLLAGLLGRKRPKRKAPPRRRQTGSRPHKRAVT